MSQLPRNSRPLVLIPSIWLPLVACRDGESVSYSLLILKPCLTDMEDAHTHLLSLPDDPQSAFFAVYDGHGGPKVGSSSFCYISQLYL